MNDDQRARLQQCFNQQNFSGAFNVCSEAINANPNDWNAIYMAGSSLRFQGRPAEAIGYYERALKLYADSAPVWLAYGIALQALGKYAEAIDALGHALRIDSNLYAAHNSLGLTYKLAGDYQSAMRAYDNAIQVRANLAFAEVRRLHPELCRVEQRGSDKVLVIDPSYAEHMRQILVTDFDYFNTMKNMVTCCIAMGDHAKARELQEHVDNCTPIDADIIPIRPNSPPT